MIKEFFEVKHSVVDELNSNSLGYEFLVFKYIKKEDAYIANSLYQNGILNILKMAGFGKRKIGKSTIFIRKIKGGIIQEMQPNDMRNFMLDYLKKFDDSGIMFEYQNVTHYAPAVLVREIFLKNSCNIFNNKWLENLPINTDLFLKDTENEMYFPFKNCIAKISKENALELLSWSSLKEVCVWENQIISHEFNFRDDFAQCHFFKFLRNVTNHDKKRWQSMVTSIGYSLHHFFRESEGQAVVLYDETITDTKNPMGGTGKGLIINAIKTMRNVAKVDGKHFSANNRFRWENVKTDTQVVCIDDVKPDFDFSVLHSNLTDGWTIEAKFHSQLFIQPKDSPKTIITSNVVLKGGGTTNKRRQFVVELSNFYSSKIKCGNEKPIEDEHGCIFFSNEYWNETEWDRFYSLMLNCAYKYLQKGLIENPTINVDFNKFKQNTDDDFVYWVNQKNIEVNKRYETSSLYNEFKEMFGEENTLGRRTFTSYLQEYASFKKLNFERFQSNSKTYCQFSNSI